MRFNKISNGWKLFWTLALITPALVLMQMTQTAYAFGPTCTVASSGANYTTIQAAASDVNCNILAVAAGTYNEHVTITRTLTINGAGAGSTIVDGTNSGTVFSITLNSSVTLNALTITGGKAADGSNSGFPGGNGSSGGGIVNGGTLTVTNSTLSGNRAGNGGSGGNGVAAGDPGGNGGNAGHGGGILNSGTLIVMSSALTGNHAGNGGNGGDGFVSSSLFVTSSRGGDGGSGGGILNSGTLTITGSTLSNNNAGNGGNGGNGVDNNNIASYGGKGGNGGSGGGISTSGSLMASSSNTLSGNSAGNGGNGGNADQFSFLGGSGGAGGNAGSGGGIANSGTLTVSNNTFSSNLSGNGGTGGFGTFSGNANNGFGGNGGGIINNSTLNVTNSAFSINSATNGGGIMNIYNATLNVSNSTFFTNTASSAGGGIYLDNPGSLNLVNSTLAGNNSPNGGAIYSVGYLTVINSTLSGNSQGILNQFIQPFTLRNTIVANNTGGNCSGYITDGGGNLQFNPNSDCGGSILSGDPKLGSLANNGGSTQTMALGAGSAAINLGIGAICAASAGSPNFGAGGLDQRGLPRRVNNAPQICDSGAFEAQPANIAVVAGSSQSAIITTNFPLPLQAVVKDAFNNILGGAVVAFAGPGSGASIAAGSATTNISGTVSFVATANGSAGGPYTVAASPSGVSAVHFSLTNLKASTLTLLISSANPSLLGQTLNITATVEVVPPITGAPTGTVTFFEVTTLYPGRTSPRAPQSVIPLSGGQAVLTTTTLTPGTHTILASYSGDGNFYNSTSPALTQVVNAVIYRYIFPLIFR